ncbi:MAG: SRPBCC family protein [Polyangiales bacterium]
MTATPPFTLDQVERSDGPLVRVLLGADGGPVGAVAARLMPASRERVFRVITDLDRLADRVPMMDKAHIDGNRVTVHLRFGIGLFSAKFSFKAERQVDEGRALELRYVEGEPRDLRIRHEVHDASAPGASVLFTTVSFDAFSLGFLAKYFLKHHPEIRFGVFPGSALTLSDAVLRALR